MRELFVARHGESELNVENVLNGDPAVRVGLTVRGEEQARALGAAVGPIELAAHTSFERTRRTAQLAWPDAKLLEVTQLDEIRFGRWEGTRWDHGYEAWVGSSRPEEECPGGGESRVVAAQRYVRGFRMLLERREERIAVVAHGAPVRYLLLAASGAPPSRILERVPLAVGYRIGRAELELAIEALEGWISNPAF
ncbi:MAG: histidine phosphatase family protein [Actinobacteria bacterium]|nr:histidine phosphatase family protein [Actinomycetota bacterium]